MNIVYEHRTSINIDELDRRFDRFPSLTPEVVRPHNEGQYLRMRYPDASPAFLVPPASTNMF